MVTLCYDTLTRSTHAPMTMLLMCAVRCGGIRRSRATKHYDGPIVIRITCTQAAAQMQDSIRDTVCVSLRCRNTLPSACLLKRTPNMCSLLSESPALSFVRCSSGWCLCCCSAARRRCRSSNDVVVHNGTTTTLSDALMMMVMMMTLLIFRYVRTGREMFSLRACAGNDSDADDNTDTLASTLGNPTTRTTLCPTQTV